MRQAKEVSWTKMFAFAPATSLVAKAKKCTCGGSNCVSAKKIKCVCRFHSENHGAANRVGMPRLETLLELDGLEVFQERPWLEIC